MDLVDIRHIAALTSLASLGVEPDLQELLVHGSVRRGVAPGALARAIDASLEAGSRPVAYACKADIEGLDAAGKDVGLSTVALPQWGMEMALYAVPPAFPPLDHEKIARLIEPDAWRWLDMMVAPFAEGRGASEGQQVYQMMWAAGVRTGDEALAWCMSSDFISGLELRRSISKAKAIVAMITS